MVHRHFRRLEFFLAIVTKASTHLVSPPLGFAKFPGFSLFPLLVFLGSWTEVEIHRSEQSIGFLDKRPGKKKSHFTERTLSLTEVKMSNQKVYKKGEVLFKDGDKISSVIFIQTGGVSQCLIRGKKNIDLFQLGANQVLGEGVITGTTTHLTSAIATTETKTLEIPVDVFKQQYESTPQFLKMLIKSLCERLKNAISDVRSNKMEKDSGPCPEEAVPRIFGALFFSARHKGEKLKDGKTEVDWSMLKSYVQRIMGESPKRLEQAINILIKMKLAEYVMGKLPEDPEGPDVIQQVRFFDLDVIEGFFEFYQYYHYKPGKGDILRFEDFTTNLVEAFVKCAENAVVDRFGAVSLEYSSVQEDVKNQWGINLNNDHFSRLEQKGVMTKRRPIDGKGVRLEFEIKELKNILFSWKMIREIDKWNEKGFVDVNEKEEKKKKPEGPSCPQCSAVITPQQKFCGDCGHKLEMKAA